MMRKIALMPVVLLVLLMASLSFGKEKDKHSLPPRATSGVDHIVVVMMENRSFDHLLGWHPTANARQSGLSYPDRDGVLQPTEPLAPDYQGCSHPDPFHSYSGGRVEYAGGKMNGFLLAGTNDDYAIGFYTESDRPFYNSLAVNYTTFDNFFSPILASTYPNRIFMHAAQTDRLDNTLDLSTLPTIWDRMNEKGVSARYYYSDVSFLWLWGNKYQANSASYEQFLADAAAGTLPSVAFVEPRLVGEAEGISGDDHPHADIRTGDAFLAATFQAVASGPDWKHTVFIVTYDEWGGFFDHIPPPRAVAPNNVDPDLVNGKALLGMRIPVVVASPFTRGVPDTPRVVSTVFDNTSILKLIEWRWNLKPLTARDGSDDVGNLAFALDFDNPDATLPLIPAPLPPEPVLCSPVLLPGELSLQDLIMLAPLGVLPAPVKP
ncbi:MAG TPA: alkaline phosphatase family protein [Geomonas sp.]|nr:alkaline phosphatase family protein [Geomonas sp.]